MLLLSQGQETPEYREYLALDNSAGQRLWIISFVHPTAGRGLTGSPVKSPALPKRPDLIQGGGAQVCFIPVMVAKAAKHGKGGVVISSEGRGIKGWG